MRIPCRLAIAAALLLACQARGQKPQLVVETGHTRPIRAVALSPDGRLLASASLDYEIKLWDVATGRELRTLYGHKGPVWSLAFSPDGRELASGSADFTIKLWDPISGQELHSLAGHTNTVSSVAFSSDGRWLASASWDRTVKLWDTQTDREVRTFAGHTDIVNQVAFSPDGRRLASAGRDRTIRIWDTSSGHNDLTLTGNSDQVNSIAFSPVQPLLASGSDDANVMLFDLTTGHALTLKGHTQSVQAVAFSPDGSTLASGSDDHTIELWDTLTHQARVRLTGHTDAVESLSFSRDGKTLASAGYDEKVMMWESATGRLIKTLAGHAASLWALAISADGRRLAAASRDTTIKIWDLSSGGAMHSLAGHTDEVNSVAFSPDASWLASGGDDHTVRTWDAGTGRQLHILTGHTLSVYSVAISPNGRWIASGSGDTTVKLWDPESGRAIRTLRGHTKTVTCVSFNPAGPLLASGSWDLSIRLWDPATGREVRTLRGHTGYVNGLAFSPDGRLLASASRDRTVKIWDVASGRELKTLNGNTDYVHGVSFSSDGQRLISSGADASVHIWEVATGRPIATLSGRADYITSAVFSHDNRFLLVSQLDGTIRVSDVTRETPTEFATMVSLDRDDWAVVDSEGRFDASPVGMGLMHYVVEKHCGAGPDYLEPIDLEQLKNRYYEPSLLPKILGFDKEPLRDVSAFDHVDLYPDVQALGDVDASGQLRVKLTNCGGGIGQIQVFVNGKQLLADARGPRPDPHAQEVTLTLNLKGAPVIPGQPNQVRIVASDAAGYIKSRGDAVNYIPPGTPENSKPELYAILVGISDYANGGLRLNFSGKDAESMAKALQLAGNRLFGADHVHIRLLSTDTDLAARWPSGGNVTWAAPTKANIQQAFLDAGQARPEDVLVVYLSGHGVAFRDANNADTYAYPTADATTIDPEDLARDSELLSQTAITSDELARWVNPPAIPALHEVMILDTCAAGSAAVKLAEMRGVPSDQIRALDQLTDSTGFHLLMGSSADAPSYEASPYGEGLLTFALLQGMKGAALKNDVDVDVGTLFDYAIDRVPDLARGVGGVQKPEAFAPSGAASFDVGELLAEDEARIPLAAPKPVILGPQFLNAIDQTDNLGLDEAVRKELRDETDIRSRGPAAIFVNAEEMPGAIRPSGLYTVHGDQVAINVVLTRDDKRVRLAVQGRAGDPSALAAKIVAAILATAKTFPPAAPADAAAPYKGSPKDSQ
jgi:WD40 repeat protein